MERVAREISAAHERIRRAYERGAAAAARGDDAAPGCTMTAEARAYLRGYVDGATRGLDDERPAPAHSS